MRLQRVLPIALLSLVTALAVPAHSAPALSETGVPTAACGPGSLPETGAQGRVSAQDVASGRADKGYRCNTTLVSHVTSAAGYKVQRYVDTAGRQCAYYDSTRLFPLNVPTGGTGTFVLDLTVPAKPVLTATLTSPAMLSPHESLRVNQLRGLLVADMGYPTTLPGVVDVYSLAADCRHPVLLASTPLGILGHESGFAPDGRTYYVSSASGPTIAAVGLDEPSHPALLWVGTGIQAHGMSVSDDGNRLYVANIGSDRLDILDVSQVQRREMLPTVPTVATLTWPDVSIPQTVEPFTRSGHRYLMEVDEFAKTTDNSQVGAARIIDVADERHPFVAANVRLQVQNPAVRAGAQAGDVNGTSTLSGYEAHYCSLPTRVDPDLLACTMIKSGLRVFDITAPSAPREVAYFNAPQAGSSDAVSSVGFDAQRRQLWYSDSASGFWAVQLTNGVWRNAARGR